MHVSLTLACGIMCWAAPQPMLTSSKWKTEMSLSPSHCWRDSFCLYPAETFWSLWTGGETHSFVSTIQENIYVGSSTDRKALETGVTEVPFQVNHWLFLLAKTQRAPCGLRFRKLPVLRTGLLYCERVLHRTHPISKRATINYINDLATLAGSQNCQLKLWVAPLWNQL